MIQLLAVLVLASNAHADGARVGSKAFTEGFLLGELAAQTIEIETKTPAQRRFGLGNTGIVYEALIKNEIDLYAEYTGTIAEAILKDPDLKDRVALEAKLKPLHLVMSKPLGFNNTYALAVTRPFAEKNSLRTISDLKNLKQPVRGAFSHEFVTRKDGLSALEKAYAIDLSSARESMEHSLAYAAIREGKADLLDVYSTDAMIETLDLVVLEDDHRYFPEYQAVILTTEKFVRENPRAWAAIGRLSGSINEKTMRQLNAQVEQQKKSFGDVISSLTNQKSAESSAFESIWRRTKEHIFLVVVTMLLATASGIPLGLIAFRSKKLGQLLILLSSIVQTIPSLALLCVLIPLFGIGVVPALVALYLYSLFPIVLGTYVGLTAIDPRQREVAQSLGLNRSQILFNIELPLASRNIVAGLRTATIIGIGTATLAAFIGAGGYGALIVSGLAINDTRTILMGAIPAAALSLIAHGAFEVASRWLIPEYI